MLRNTVLSIASFIRLDKLFYGIKKKRGLATVLSLHRISDEPDFFWPPMTVGNFNYLLEYCGTSYDVCSLSDLKMRSSRPKLVLSFDDGYADFIENALPALNQFGFPSNHNVVINCVEGNETIWTHDLADIFSFLRKNKLSNASAIVEAGIFIDGSDNSWRRAHQKMYSDLLLKTKDERLSVLKRLRNEHDVPAGQVRMMNWDQVKTCATRDVDIGSHTLSHHTLTRMSADDLTRELADSKIIIEQQLGRPCDTIAVPNGQSDSLVNEIAATIGYRRLLLANDQLLRTQENGGLRSVSRVNVVEEPFPQMKLRIEGFHHFLKNGRL